MEHNYPPGTRKKKRKGLIVLLVFVFGIIYQIKNLNIYIIFIEFQ